MNPLSSLQEIDKATTALEMIARFSNPTPDLVIRLSRIRTDMLWVEKYLQQDLLDSIKNFTRHQHWVREGGD